jgi:hypothetical protein
VDLRFRIGLRCLPEHPGRAFKKLIASLLDLVGMDVEILGQLDQRLLALDRGHRHSLGGKTIPQIVFLSASYLGCRAVVPARSSCHGLLLARSIMSQLRGKLTYPGCSNFRSQLY